MATNTPGSTEQDVERVYLAGVVFPGEDEFASEYMEELKRLAKTAGGLVVGGAQQKRIRPHPSTFMGKGKILEIAADAKSLDASLLIVDNDLSPAQARNMEKLSGLPLIDRSQLIMDIFAAGARTLQARKQVELAQLEYTLPRLKRMWSHLSRIRSSIGMRGPGETQLEVDRRMIRLKISELKRSLKKIEGRKQREIGARGRYFKVSLVGYTNSGKSTLLNRLTGADVLVEDRLFSTLDTRTRKWDLDDSQTVLLSDTVGFIRKLPHHLVASFHATLEEAATADLLVHVVDSSQPAVERNMMAVNDVLGDLGVGATPQILVFNKTDLGGDFMEMTRLSRDLPFHVLTSAATGQGLDELTALVSRHQLDTFALLSATVPAAAGRLRAFIAEHGSVLTSVSRDSVETITFRLPRWNLGQLRRIAVVENGVLEEEPAREHWTDSPSDRGDHL